MLTQADIAVFEKTGHVTPDRLRALRSGLEQRRNDSLSYVHEHPDEDERKLAAMRGKAKGYWEAMMLVDQLLRGDRMTKPRWSTTRLKSRAVRMRRLLHVDK